MTVEIEMKSVGGVWYDRHVVTDDRSVEVKVYLPFFEAGWDCLFVALNVMFGCKGASKVHTQAERGNWFVR